MTSDTMKSDCAQLADGGGRYFSTTVVLCLFEITKDPTNANAPIPASRRSDRWIVWARAFAGLSAMVSIAYDFGGTKRRPCWLAETALIFSVREPVEAGNEH